MPNFGDSAFLIVLALLLFGPKKLPELARQLGKLMADFRRASNEFRTQMEEELRISEQAERQKQIAAIQTATPAPAETIPEPEHPHLPPPPPSFASTSDEGSSYAPESPSETPSDTGPEYMAPNTPIATSGELSIMPPATGLPVANTASAASPEAGNEVQATAPVQHPASPAREAELETETLHG